MQHDDLISALRQELGIKDDEPDEAILNAVACLKANLTAAMTRSPEDEKAMDIIRRVAEHLESLQDHSCAQQKAIEDKDSEKTEKS